MGSRKFQLAFWQQELVQLRHETGIQFHERLVEAVIEHLCLLLFHLVGVEGFQQVGSLVSLDLSAHQFTIVGQLADICSTDVHEESHVGLSLDVCFYQLLVQLGELCVHFFLLLVLLFYLLLVFLQLVLLSVVDEGENEDDDECYANTDEAEEETGT